MAENKDTINLDEESNIEDINKFVTSEDDIDADDMTEKPVAADDDSKEEQSEKEEQKKEERKKPEKKVHKISHDQKKEEHKKPEPKKVEHKTNVVHNRPAPKKETHETKVQEPVKTKKFVKPAKENRTRERREKKGSNILLWIGIGVLALILIGALVMLFWPDRMQPKNDNQTTNTVAATVNGEAIYLQEITTQYANLNPVLQQLYTIDSLLNKSIDDLLLYQESKKEGITIPADTIQKELQAVMEQNSITEKQLEEALSKQGMTLDDAKKVIEKNLGIRELLNKTILQDIKITESQIEDYYDANMEEFKVPERVTVQHILILASGNVSNETAKARIEQVKSELTKDNFCELAKKYSEDPGSKDNCGEYTFGKGDFNNPEFENPSFNLKVGETSIIQTAFGYHLIKKIASLPAGTMSLKEVYDDINGTLYDTAAQNKFDILLNQLRNNSVIVNYYTKTEGTVPNTTLVPLETLDDFAKCITEKNATLYGAYWCPHCENQKKMFGESIDYVNYVECAVEGKPQVQTEACTKAGVEGYPTWIINGKQYPGEQTLQRLSTLTGCSLN